MNFATSCMGMAFLRLCWSVGRYLAELGDESSQVYAKAAKKIYDDSAAFGAYPDGFLSSPFLGLFLSTPHCHCCFCCFSIDTTDLT